MAVSVDTVYQKVLALINKEQRGYITPQEFNLLADKAQVEIFESYFHSLKDDYHKLKNNINFADNSEMNMENLHPFQNSTTIGVGTNGELNPLPSLHRIKGVQRIEADGTTTEVDEVVEKELLEILNNPLLSPTKKRSIYIRSMSSGIPILKVYPAPTLVTNFTVKYYSRPTPPKWAYVVVNEKALFNGNEARNFMLNPSEEEKLVTRILELAGVIIQKPGLVEVAMTQAARTKQEQNN